MLNLYRNYLIKKDKYIIDLRKVDFITYSKNEKEHNTYWVKFHIGGKETRIQCRKQELQDTMNNWVKVNEVNYTSEYGLEMDDIFEKEKEW